MAAAELHVVPHTSTGGWTLDSAGTRPAWFATLTEAEQAARREASARNAPAYLHDRYHRVRRIGTSRQR
jgi:hypothetical protein